MRRLTRPHKPLIYIFCEGESEQQYARFLRQQFMDAAVLKCASKTGLFDFAADKFVKDAKYRDSLPVTDEIWFFFDVEDFDQDKWDSRYEIIKKLRRLRKSPTIRVRLLMTRACVEYWFLLHYEKVAPPIATSADKERILKRLQRFVPDYQKGAAQPIWTIGSFYTEAVQNSGQVLASLLPEGLPSLEETDERNRWLVHCGKTFSTVQDALNYLESL